MNEYNRARNSSAPRREGWGGSLADDHLGPAGPARRPGGKRPGQRPAGPRGGGNRQGGRGGQAPKPKSDESMGWVDWRRVLELQENETVCYAEVVSWNKGGLLVRAQEFQGFVPRSHLQATANGQRITEKLLESYMGKEMELKVIECDPERGRIVLSERAAESAPGSRQGLLQTLQPGQQVEGKVTNVTNFGLFIDLGGVEGLVHISELSWGRVGHPREVASPGQMLSVVVLEINSDLERVSLSVKRGQANPWASVLERFPEGAEASGEITEVVHFGAFAKLEEGLEGLIHITQMGLHHRLDPRLVLEAGMQVQVKVLQVEPDRQRLSLQLLGEPWKDQAEGPAWLETPGEHA
ncbi:MAG: S1 RNA-binding domain-containing protein [Anaerolineales bacterium]|nr:S1 RNA-binding domain-containing protein [Anaerolineales bacterium]